MSFLDRLFGRDKAPEPQPPASPRERFDPGAGALTDEQAIQRYRYMLQTAPPETIEQAHEEAFAQLTPSQRAQVLRELSATLPPHERAALAPNQDDPRTLARMATRAELRQPGTLERTFGGMGGGMIGMGMGGTFLSSLAGAFVGSMIAQQFFNSFDPGFADTGGHSESGLEQEVGADPALDDPGYDSGGGFGDDLGGDFGGDLGGDFGADV